MTFLAQTTQLLSFFKKINFGGKISFFRFLGFFEKNLKPKKFVLGGKNEKNQKSKGGFWKKMKSFRKESVLYFDQKLGESGLISLFSIFSSTPFGAIVLRL